jgi:pimeloyl-ACP methyl ester carboxylesterase
VAVDLEEIEIEANGLVFRARAAGPADGRLVVLLHGFPQTSWSWRHVLPALAASGYRAVAMDQRGYSPGARPLAVADYRIGHLVDDVVAVAEALGTGASAANTSGANTSGASTSGAERFDLVGHDWGGMVAWTVAGRHPERLRSVSVVSTPHPDALGAVIMAGQDDQADRMSYIGFFQQPDEPERQLLGEDGSGSGLRELFATTGLDPAATDEYVAVLTAPGAMTAALNWYRAMDAIEPLGPVAVPALYVWSSDDPALGRAAAEATADWVTGPYRFSVLDGVSHWVPEEAATELSGLLLDQLSAT